jgi:hypothetical protein
VGKKSREKMEREYQQPAMPKFLYRYLPTKELADGMLNGEIRISTLREVREGESLRADRREATLTYSVFSATGLNGILSPEAENLERLGIRLGDHSSVRHSRINFRHPGAYVLCTAQSSCDDKRMRRVFGQHRVRISDPLALMDAIGERIADHVQGRIRGLSSPLDYLGRDRSGPRRLNASPIFIGHPENAHESEYRIVWETLDGSPPEQPLDLHVPELARLCSMCD